MLTVSDGLDGGPMVFITTILPNITCGSGFNAAATYLLSLCIKSMITLALDVR